MRRHIKKRIGPGGFACAIREPSRSRAPLRAKTSVFVLVVRVREVIVRMR